MLGPDRGWAAALSLAGIDLAPGEVTADLVVASAGAQHEAVASGAPMLLVEGPARRGPLRAAGYQVARYLVLPDVDHPELLVPVDDAHPRRYALRRRVAGAGWRRRAAVGVGAWAAATAPTAVRPASLLTVAARQAGLPFPVAAAGPLGVPRDVDWYLLLGTSHELAERRMAFLAFPAGHRLPSWAVKVARVPGLEDAFAADERGLRQLEAAAPRRIDHAPKVLGRTEVAGLALSVETAAVGDRLTEVLRLGGRSRVPLVDAIADWLVGLGVDSQQRRPPAVDAAWLARVASTVGGHLDPAALLRTLDQCPSVLAHGDLGTWNVVAGDGGFTVIDWESARPDGAPLTDLVHLLVDACAQMERRARPADRAAYVRALLRGDAELSPVVFEHVRRAAHQLQLPPEAAGALATLTWLQRADLVGRHSSGQETSPAAQVARAWLTDPELGTSWPALR